MQVKMLSATVRCLMMSAVLGLAGCGGDTAGGGGGSGSNAAAVPVVLQPLTLAEADTLSFVREEEKMARDVYLTLYNQWANATFQTIATRSEQKHMDKVKLLLDAAGLPDPVLSDAVGVFSNSAIADLYLQLVARGSMSSTEALAVGAYIEEYDIEDLQQAITEAVTGTNQVALIAAYDNLMCGSRNHLRSFVGQIEANGVTYQAQLLPQATVDWIVDSPQERCGQ